jgi:hypothetical protein
MLSAVTLWLLACAVLPDFPRGEERRFAAVPCLILTGLVLYLYYRYFFREIVHRYRAAFQQKKHSFFDKRR